MDIRKWDLPVQSLFKTIGVYIKIVIGVLRRCKSIGTSSMLHEGRNKSDLQTNVRIT